MLLLFLTPLPPEVRAHAAALAAAQILLPVLGLLAVLPVATGEEPASTTTMAIGFLIAFVELIADALPGILLRLHSTVIGGAATLSSVPTWLPSPLRDQQLSGDVLWFLGEAIDLPFLAWLVVRWIRRRPARGGGGGRPAGRRRTTTGPGGRSSARPARAEAL